MLTGEARTPEGMRLYAIGDIHGCEGKLVAVHEAIAADLAARPSPDHRIVHIGDYADRGPNSAGVIERLSRLTSDPHMVFLRGNHDQLLLDFLAEPGERGAFFLKWGGKETLRSYRVSNRARTYEDLAAAFAEKLPAAHRAFLDGLQYSARFGDYFFAHAGIRPGVPLEAQAPDDLLWIRDEFLTDRQDFGAVVVHGHTVTQTQAPEVHPNRIAIDTGAVFNGPLTCVVLEGNAVRFL
jgi:serine/threonine protein phosphatase 1